jgi:hypothetical protein
LLHSDEWMIDHHNALAYGTPTTVQAVSPASGTPRDPKRGLDTDQQAFKANDWKEATFKSQSWLS